MTANNYSMSDIHNLAVEVKELAAFQNSIVWCSEPFTWDFQQELINVLLDKSQLLESMISDAEFKVLIKSDS